ncbi:hydrophobic surface binding protein A-domain-containing protein [Xylariales sp. AK1849]|nr:hydrophobic surface binding protein A-domain-containing protein [Xylariales sp. AK1849]
MVKFESIILFATAISAATIRRRDAAETLANLQTIDADTDSLTTTVTDWDGSVLGALGISSSATALENEIDDTNTDASDDTVYSSADSAEIVAYITDTLEPDIAASLNEIVAREADFESAGVASLVLSQLQSLQESEDTYGATLLGLFSSDQTAAAQAVQDQIDADFDAAIAAFS